MYDWQPEIAVYDPAYGIGSSLIVNETGIFNNERMAALKSGLYPALWNLFHAF